MNWISLIPVRAGSKGLTNKNIRSICGLPLYRYTVNFARAAGSEMVYVTTDIKEILSSPPEDKIMITRRDSSLCQDDTKMSSVILNFLVKKEGAQIEDDKTIVLLQATSPLRKRETLLDALEKFSQSKKIDLMMAVTKTENNALKYGYVIDGHFKHIAEPHLCFENRQDLPDLFKPTGDFYIFKAGWFRSNKSLATKATGAYEIPTSQSLDIDCLADLEHFETILKTKG